MQLRHRLNQAGLYAQVHLQLCQAFAALQDWPSLQACAISPQVSP